MARNPTLGVPRVHYLEQNTPHPSDRPTMFFSHDDIEEINGRYGTSYYDELYSKRTRTRQNGV